MKLWTPSKIRSTKGYGKLPCLTAYDALTARFVDSAGIPLILVGDSLATTALGFETTLPATMETMLHHTAAVARVAKNSVVVADMPFLSYQISADTALSNAGRFLQEAGADAVKIEGGSVRAGLIRRMVDNGIPVMAHIGLLPQSVHETGYKVRGRTPEDAERVMSDAKAVADAGAFAVTLECVMPELAEKITAAIKIPTIGIGAGTKCDGQILVLADMLGMTPGPVPQFVKKFANIADIASGAIREYAESVADGSYPDAEHVYTHKPATPKTVS